MELRSNYEPGTSRWATRRAQWRALGLSDEDMTKPKIAVVNSSSDMAICYSHLDDIARRVKQEIRAAGGIGFEIRTTAPSDFIHSAGGSGGYILSSRDLIVNDIEAAVEGGQLDGMICLASCDKTAPAQLMAAGRLNLPTIIVACGYQPAGSFRGSHCDIEDVFLAAGHLAQGRIGLDELTEMSEKAVLGPGVCAGLGTANSMHIVCEALGMALPGSTPVLANSTAMWDTVSAASRRIVDMVRTGLKPRQILTRDAFANAVMTVLAIGGSINCVKHLQAVAAEAECDVDVYRLFEEYADRVPLLSAVRPNGPHPIEAFEAAGGAAGVLKQLEAQLHTETLTVTGRTLGDNLADVRVADEEIIRPTDNPLAQRPAVVVVRGTLAPATGIVKLAVDEERKLTFDGTAIVYDSVDDAMAGLRNGEVREGHVLVLRGQGPKGSPGMGMASRPVFALDGAGLTGKVAVVTDGQLSGLVNKGLVVGEVSPEAADGGPLGLVENGDRITIDVAAKTVNLEVPEKVLAQRRSGLVKAANPRGWLSIYRSTVTPLQKGAVLTGE